MYSKKTCSNISYTIIFILLFLALFYSFRIQRSLKSSLNNSIDLSFRDNTNKNSNVGFLENKLLNFRKKEGFTGFKKQKKSQESEYVKDEDLFKLIDRKLKSLMEEIGGKQGKNDIKKLLKNTKDICTLECAKCMFNMIDETKEAKSIDIENLLNDEDNDNCIKCKKYTELSDTIKSLIDNL